MTVIAPRSDAQPALGVVFDLDGTLIDSRADIVRATNGTRAREGLPPLPPETVHGFVGDGAKKLVQRAFGIHGETRELARLVDVFLDEYTKEPVVDTAVLPGVWEMLDALSALPLAICTNKPRRTTVPVLEVLRLAERFQVIVAGGDTKEAKPSREPLIAVAYHLGVGASRLVMVGDGPQDILAARAVGAHAVGVRGGFLPIERLVESRPDVILDHIGELPAYLARVGLRA